MATYDVLLVDDEAELAASTGEYLAAFGVTAMCAGSAEEALTALRQHRVRLILLDVNLPGMSGFEFCRTVRQREGEQTQLPIVFLSARRSDDDEILALSLGGDDYLRKPYSLSVLLAKVRRILDRHAAHGASQPTGYDDGYLRFDADADRFWVAGAEVVLPAMEHRLLRYAVEHRGKVLTKRELFVHVWGDAITGEGTLTVHVRRLRQRIEPDPDHPTYLRTVHGRGYLFEGPAS